MICDSIVLVVSVSGLSETDGTGILTSVSLSDEKNYSIAFVIFNKIK